GGSGGILQGLGVRVVLGDAIGYAYTERFDPESMREAARTAANIAASGGSGAIHPQPVERVAGADLYPVERFSVDEPAATTLALLRRADAAARAVAPSIARVEVSLLEGVKRIVVATSEGRLAGDVQPLVRLDTTALSVRDGDRQRAGHTVGARAGLAHFAGEERSPEAIGRRAAEAAVHLHDAVEAPAGFLPVVLAPGDSGVLLHEAVGHGLEADFNRKRTSNFTDRIGQRVASPLCTVVDDGTIPGSGGSINIDDEGHPPRRNVLIEGGVLRGYLHDWISARHFGVVPSGNGRRESVRHYPMPRMTSTFMLPGDAAPEEIIGSVRRGIYCVRFSGGQVNISNGDYVFSSTESYLIEDGRVTAPLRAINLIGNGPDSMTRVTMVGDDLRLSEGVWNCGKNGQWAPVNLGLPTILVDGITVGGTGR
ncbi:MAG: metallopeptidase TldD-related protein, partial [Chloroflexota bacterium]|nr:metallopeptidase TldD-related protein [Chloroflexota bacterium]